MKIKFVLSLTLLLVVITTCKPVRKNKVSNNNQTKPNIILIMMDDLDFDEVNCYKTEDYPSFTATKIKGLKNFDPSGAFSKPGQLMPNIDRMAKEGMVFEKFYTTASVCTPVRYSIFTGNYACRSQFFIKNHPAGTEADINWNTYLTPEEDNIAKEMKKLGYATGIVGKWHNGFNGKPFRYPKFPEDLTNPDSLKFIKENYRLLQSFLTKEIGFDYAEALHYDNPIIQNLDWMSDKAVEFISKNADRPFFLYLAPPLPHCQYRGMDHYDPLITTCGKLDKAPSSQKGYKNALHRIRFRGYEKRKVMGTWIDNHIGALLSTLKEYGLEENTLIILTSDQQTRGKFTCYETCRVPFIAWWPGTIPSGSRSNFFGADIDLFPTFIELAGGTPPPTDGKSFAKYILNQQSPPGWRKYLFLEIAYSRAVVTPEWKYIANRPPDSILILMQKDNEYSLQNHKIRSIGWDGSCGTPGESSLWGTRFGNDFFFPYYWDADQLYDLSDDIFEQNNLAYKSEYAKKLEEMKGYLKETLVKFPFKFGEFTE